MFLKKWFGSEGMYDFYVCGPMRHYPELNRHMFALVSKLLRDKGYKVWSPSEYDDEHSSDSLYRRMTIDLNVVINQCDRVALLPGWRKSLGANAEVFSAFVCGKEVVEVILSSTEEDQYIPNDDSHIVDLVIVDLNNYCLPYQISNL